MIKAHVGKGIGCSVEGSGSPREQTNDLLHIIGSVYKGIDRAGIPGLAEMFRHTLILALLDGDNPCWRVGGEGYTMVMPNGKGNAHEQ